MDFKKIEDAVHAIPNLKITNINDKEIHMISTSACLTEDSLRRIRKTIGLVRIWVTWCPCSGYNPGGIVLAGTFKK